MAGVDNRETSHRDRWKRVSISRFRLDWRIRNREAWITHRFWETSLDSLRKNRPDKMATRSAKKT